MEIKYSTKAERQFLKFHVADQKKILKGTRLLRQNPYAGKKLKGEWKGLFSLKSWPLRLIYQIDKHNQVINVVNIEHRQQVYK